MRWKDRQYKRGEHRLVRRFLWLPMQIGDDCRWLEWATIEQEFDTWYDPYSGEGSTWTNIAFVEEGVL